MGKPDATAEQHKNLFPMGNIEMLNKLANRYYFSGRKK